jgi:BirA family biotin operon repressor/biotin-[acetyl-CoA-carboxylase] ligase
MSIPSDLAPEKIQAALRSRLIGRPLEVLVEVGSTNDTAMAAGRAGAPEGLAILADRQTAGRGRRGRAWASPPGVGLYTSILLRPAQPLAQASLLTLAGGLAVAEAISEVADREVRLKWPNDVLVDGRKVAGILTEMASVDAWVSQVVVGIGINVNHGPPDLPEELSPVATSLAQATGRSISRCDLAAAVYNGLDRWYQVFREGGTETILAHGRGLSATLGQTVEVEAEEGRWQGLAVDLDGDGALLVQEEAGAVRRVIAGDVSIRNVETFKRSHV